jgi:hypothetical protein
VVYVIVGIWMIAILRRSRGRTGPAAFALGVAVALLAPLTPPVVSNAAAKPPRLLASSSLAVQTSGLEFFDAFGTAVAVIGDVDGNGVVDVAVGAPQDDDGGDDRGAVYVFLLDAAANALSVTKISSGSGGFAGPLRDGDRFGSALAGIGDVDGDGIPDLAVGAIGDDDDALDAGAVWILSLAVDGSVTGAHKLGGLSPGLQGTLEQWDSFGSSIVRVSDSVASAPLVLAVGLRSRDGGGFDRGAVWILTLASDFAVSSRSTLDDSTPALQGKLADRGWFGAALARSGQRLAVGAPGDETVFAADGRVWLVDLLADGSVASAVEIPTTQPGDRFGRAVTFYGDLDFDGNQDLAVGRPKKDAYVSDQRGAVDILLLDASSGVRERLTYPAGVSHPEIAAYGRGGAGTSLATLPDLDDNLVPELLTGGPDDNPGGGAWVYFLNGLSADGASCGDPTGDGEVQATDALLVLRAAVRLTFCELLYCDVDRSGRISASDALLVLHEAVATAITLTCPTTTTSTTSTSIAIDECFFHEDCQAYGNPERPYCCAYVCCECDAPEHCDDGETCGPDGVCRPGP